MRKGCFTGKGGIKLHEGPFFSDRRARADFAAFDKLMRRKDGEAPGPNDKIG
jgi:hypothetical protein